jgi:hypothetical protein
MKISQAILSMKENQLPQILYKVSLQVNKRKTVPNSGQFPSKTEQAEMPNP